MVAEQLQNVRAEIRKACEKSDRTVAFGLERNGWKDRKSNSGTDAKNIWFGS